MLHVPLGREGALCARICADDVGNDGAPSPYGEECLIATFGMAMYYRMRKGTRLITPAEQETIYNLLEQQGITERPAFDAYTEDYLW